MWPIVSTPRPPKALSVAFVVILAVAAGVGAFTVVRSGRGDSSASKGTAAPTASSAAGSTAGSALPPVLGAATVAPSTIPSTAAPEPSAAAIAAALAAPLADPSLGSSVLAEVSDALTGNVLFDRSSTTSAAPASTAKLATAAAVLAVHKASDRITTTVVAGASAGQIVLVGGGDPTLSAAAGGQPTPYPDAARISDLAAQVKATGKPVTRVLVDDSLFSGPLVSPTWQREDVPSDYASAITAVLADGGRATPTDPIRSSTPDLAAGQALAADLGVPASHVARGPAPANAAVLGRVQSATYGELVNQMLLDSDNVIAECLARQVAIATHQPASFTGAAAAVRTALQALGVDIGPGLTDGSGLADSDRLTPAAVVAVVRLAATNAHPGLSDVISDLPVAAWDGTLANRYLTAPSSAGAGRVWAKTGTLTSVSTLAGVVLTASGRLLIFSFVANRVGPTTQATDAAEAALDVLAAALVA